MTAVETTEVTLHAPSVDAYVTTEVESTPLVKRIDDETYARLCTGALDRTPRARNATEAQFLALGEGARLWLVEAAAAGTTKMRVKIGEALVLAKLFGATEVPNGPDIWVSKRRASRDNVSSCMANGPSVNDCILGFVE